MPRHFSGIFQTLLIAAILSPNVAMTQSCSSVGQGCTGQTQAPCCTGLICNLKTGKCVAPLSCNPNSSLPCLQCHCGFPEACASPNCRCVAALGKKWLPGNNLVPGKWLTECPANKYPPTIMCPGDCAGSHPIVH